MSQYTEPVASSEPIRRLYADSVTNAVEIMREWATHRREERISPQRMASNREDFREEFASLLGIDICNEVFGVRMPECERSYVGEDENARIERLKIKVAEKVYFTGLLLTPRKRSNKAPIVIMSHGGGGSPELCCDILGENNYGGVVKGLLLDGVIVFAPQLLLWNLNPTLCESSLPNYTTFYDRAARDNDLKQCGVSIAGFEIYCISRTLDYLLQAENIDEERCGMLGLSYGGFYTLYTMANERRIKVGFSAAFFNDRMQYNWSDFVWNGSVQRFLDVEVAGLCAPRKLIVDIGKKDTVFDYRGGERQKHRLFEFFKAAGAERNLKFNIWEGGHKFSPESFRLFKNWLNG